MSRLHGIFISFFAVSSANGLLRDLRQLENGMMVFRYDLSVCCENEFCICSVLYVIFYILIGLYIRSSEYWDKINKISMYPLINETCTTVWNTVFIKSLNFSKQCNDIQYIYIYIMFKLHFWTNILIAQCFPAFFLLGY